MVDIKLDKLNEILKELKELPRIKEVVALRKRLAKEKIKLEAPAPVEAPAITKEQIKTKANQSRSIKQIRNWRFYRQIRNFFPDLSLLKIRREFAKKRKGEESSIPDAVWQNPSP